MAKHVSSAARPTQPPHTSTTSSQKVLPNGSVNSAILSGTGLTYETINVTDDLAKDWLATNPEGNRRASRATVHAYARDIISGDWLLTGDPIRFDKTGKMIDGQHRCYALLYANEQLRKNGEKPKILISRVIRGFDPAVMRVLDHGRKRTIGDQITIEGKRWGTIIGAAAKWLYIFKNGAVAIGKGRTTSSEIMNMIDNHPKLENSASVCYRSRMGMNASLLTAIHYTGAHLLGKPEIADEFAAVTVEGVPVYEGDAAFAWRERIAKSRLSKTKLPERELMIGSIHAWNLFSDRVTALRIHIPTEAAFRELDYHLL
jgi:hypothetical protein